MRFNPEDYEEFKESNDWTKNFEKPYTLSKFVAYKRGMGFKPINKYIKKDIAHHINNTFIVYVPKELHEHSYNRNKKLHRKEVKSRIRKVNKILYLKILVYNFINIFKNEI